ncbi:hypothetical protein [Amphritea sp. HPY]|uniref:hypothetical protein n=1 Tax=Amphritea sp. HPY TaxID=3421652 RepID=UPI003D7D7276
MNSITTPAEPADTSYYVVDLKEFDFCKGLSDVCQSMTSITIDAYFAGAIEESYKQKITGPNYRASLARMILTPANKSYTSEQISENGRYHRVPANDMTDTVWKTLTEIQSRYDRAH